MLQRILDNMNKFSSVVGRKIPSLKGGVFPGENWLYLFLKRHKKDISQRYAQLITHSHGLLTLEEFHKYFKNLECTLAGVPAENIFNYDETNVSNNAGSEELLYRRGIVTAACLNIYVPIYLD